MGVHRVGSVIMRCLLSGCPLSGVCNNEVSVKWVPVKQGLTVNILPFRDCPLQKAAITLS